MARPVSTDSSPRTKRSVTVTFPTIADLEEAKAHADARGLGLATLFKYLLKQDMKDHPGK